MDSYSFYGIDLLSRLEHMPYVGHRNEFGICCFMAVRSMAIIGTR